jgi:hypothetical protein
MKLKTRSGSVVNPHFKKKLTEIPVTCLIPNGKLADTEGVAVYPKLSKPEQIPIKTNLL